MRLGLIGCGSIGREVIAAIADGRLPDIELAGVVDLEGNESAQGFAASLSYLKPDLVLEAASAGAAPTAGWLKFCRVIRKCR